MQNITNQAVFRLAFATNEEKGKIYAAGINYAAAIKKAKQLMQVPQAAHTIEKLDDLIGECSLPAAKIVHGDAMTLE